MNGHGKYVGEDLRLKGKTALLMEASPGYVVAQFDDTSLVEAVGWWPFKVLEFEMDPPTPTEKEFKASYKQAYIAAFVKRGLTPEAAKACFEVADFDGIRDVSPERAVDDEISYWDDDGEDPNEC